MGPSLRRWLPVLFLVALMVALATVFRREPLELPSALSRAPTGLKVAARYLEESGRQVAFLQDAVFQTGGTPEAEVPEEAVLVTALPSARHWTPEDAAATLAWVRAGGHLVVLASARSELPQPLAEALGVTAEERPEGDPGDWESWALHHQRASTFSGPAGRLQGDLDAWRVDCPEVPVPAMGGQRAILATYTGSYRDGEGRPHVCTIAMGDGEAMVVDDASILWNQRLAVADNLSFLESLAPEGGMVYFDEYHQGFSPAEEGELGLRLDLLLGQACLLYLGLAWRSARPLGPPRAGLPEREPGMVAELRTLGRLHAAGGHGEEATVQLLETARRRFAGDPRLEGVGELGTAGGLAELLAIGQRLAEMERGTA